MLLSIIIVNYNVKYFLEQCLCSVQRAIINIETEIIVVDNNSIDNSLDYLRPKFPAVKFIANSENLGFAKACNQGLQSAKGKYILFLNPDCIVPEDCLSKCISFLEWHGDAGALGIQMLDGRGRFLKESKRAFPSPLTSLFKLFGLSQLFPHSKIFARYHLGYLDAKKNHEVDVLAGAFLMIKWEVLKTVGSFDETFFMYGEDIDLSYRIQQAGFKNYYFAETNIIHFKGESTRKGSLNYVKMFYKAMSLFVQKHYGGSKAGLFNFSVHCAIWIRAAMSALGRFIKWIGLPVLDAILILFSFWLVKNFWVKYMKVGIDYPDELLWIAFPVFTLMYLLVAYYAGLYDQWYKRSELIRSTLIATVVLLAAYSLLPEYYRFSRGIILFGAILAFVLISILRWLLIQNAVIYNNDEKEVHAHTLIVGSPDEYDKVIYLMKEAGLPERVLGRVAVHENDVSGIGYWENINMLYPAVPFREAIFCEGTLTFKNIIDAIEKLPASVKIKFHAAGSLSIVGSDSKNTAGHSLSEENGFNLANPHNRRLKRLIDFFTAFLFLITFPIHFLGVRKPFSFFLNCFKVLIAQNTWIGYAAHDNRRPALRRGIIAGNGMSISKQQLLPHESLYMIDYWYAKDYEPANDLKILWRKYRQLGG